MRIYITHCSAKKDDSLKQSARGVTPDALYTARPTQRFMLACKEAGVHWAIFSDLYGIWLPDEKHQWYEKNPDTVTEREFKALLGHFDERLQGCDEIWFYCNPGRFHRLYRRVVAESGLRGRITVFTHIRDIA